MAKISQDQGAKLMVEILCVDQYYADKECDKMFGAHIGFAWLKNFFTSISLRPWDGMTLTYLYTYLSKATKYQIMLMGGYITIM